MNSSGWGGPRPPSHSPQPPPMSPLTPATPIEEPRTPAPDSLAQQPETENNGTAHLPQLPPIDPHGEQQAASDEPANAAPPDSQNAAQSQNEDQQNLQTQGTLGESQQTLSSNNTMQHDAPFTNAAMDLFAQQPMATIPNYDLILALTNMSANQTHMPLPTSISPAQMSLPRGARALGDTQTAKGELKGAEATDDPLESFARISFADSEFQMTTYAVIIGRDQKALEQARRDAKRNEEYQRRVEENALQGLPPPSPPSNQQPRFSRSWYSEEGGMLGPESDGDGPRPAKRRKTSANGSGSGNSQQHHQQQDSQVPAEDEGAAQDMIVNRQYVSHTPGAAAVDLTSLRPSPYDVPFIGIHSPGQDSSEIAANTKGISRQHLKIQFNQDTGVFEAHPLHKNGFFCQDVHYKDREVVLRSGDRIQIKDVDFVFYINGVAEGKTGAEEFAEEDRKRRYSEGGKEMSFEFESSHAGEIRSTSEEEAEVAPEVEKDSQSELSDVPDDDMEVDENDDSQVLETIENDAEENGHEIKRETADPEPQSQLPAMPPKRRGPGRPPKNGIMSKREERLMKKQAMELAKKTLPQPPPGEPPVKRKVGRPRKHPLPEEGGDRPEKRKYKPRKPKGEDGAEGSDGEKVVKEKKREKPKTPPLELDRDNYTEEQLQKPNKNYGVLIDEVLTAAPDGLTLKQIYKRIQMKYPFYYFSTETKGWESSVRHNLIGNIAFKKNEETHLWSRVPGIDIDAGKKRKAPSPDQTMTPHGYMGPYQQPHMGQGAMYQGQHMTPHGYQAGQMPHGYPQNHYQPNQATQQPQQQQYAQQPVTTAVGQPGVQAPQQPQSAAQQMPHPAPASGQAATHPNHNFQQRPVQMGVQPSPYASPYPRPQVTPGAAPPGTTPHSLAHQASQPQSSAHAPNGLSQVPNAPAPAQPTPSMAPGAGVARPTQPALPTPAVPPKPLLAPEFLKFIVSFKTTLTEQLKTRISAPEALALSVINQGLGLANRSMVPTILSLLPPGKERDEELVRAESLEKVVMGVFDKTRAAKATPEEPLVFPPKLLEMLVNFKNRIVEKITSKIGFDRSEALTMSAINRILGFVDHSIVKARELEKQEFVDAEKLVMDLVTKDVVDRYQRMQATGTA